MSTNVSHALQGISVLEYMGKQPHLMVSVMKAIIAQRENHHQKVYHVQRAHLEI